MIINTGQRTDIPAFYPEWFANRLREGFVMARNPYNPLQVSRYRLDREVVDAIGFCSKNPGPFFKYMDLELQTFKNLDDNYVSKKKNYIYYKKQFDSNLENAAALMKIKNNVLMSKTMYGYYLNKYYNEYFRLNEVHSARLKKLINKLNKQKDVYYSDMVKLIQFLSIE